MQLNRTRTRRIVLTAAAAFCAAPLLHALHAQARDERAAFTWEGRIRDGRWIMVRNLNGPVEVVSGTSDKVEVTASRHTRRGDPDYVRFEVKKFGPNAEDVLICALWGEDSSCDERGYRNRNNERGRNRNEVSVEFRVRVPKGVKVAAHSVNGEVSVDGVDSEVDAGTVNGGVLVRSGSGPVNANTVNGSVRAMMGRFNLDTDLSFSSVNGTVIAEFAEDLNADVELSTVNGRFLTDFPVTISGRIDPRRLRATLGKGGPRVRLTTVNGNVELRKR
jgi:hypothetical protein